MKAFRSHTPRQHQRGNAVVFALLGLVISSITLAIGIPMYQSAERAASVQGFVPEVVAIVGSAKGTFGQLSYAGLTTGQAVQAGVIPANLRATSTTARSRFGGAINLVDNAAGTAALTYEAVPGDQCAEIVMGTQAIALTVTVAGTVVKAAAAQVNPASLATACASASTVDIRWTFGRA